MWQELLKQAIGSLRTLQTWAQSVWRAVNEEGKGYLIRRVTREWVFEGHHWNSTLLGEMEASRGV